jgi:hypothetical protein
MENETDPLARFGSDAIDLRWTLKDIAAKRAWMINKQHLAKLTDLGLVLANPRHSWNVYLTTRSEKPAREVASDP